MHFTLEPLYSWGESIWCPLNRRLCGANSQSGCFGMETCIVHSTALSWYRLSYLRARLKCKILLCCLWYLRFSHQWVSRLKSSGMYGQVWQNMRFFFGQQPLRKKSLQQPHKGCVNKMLWWWDCSELVQNSAKCTVCLKSVITVITYAMSMVKTKQV
jgi:hypothetical protein